MARAFTPIIQIAARGGEGQIMFKLKERKEPWPKGTKWKITSIRFPFALAQEYERRQIAQGAKSASDGLVQLMEQYVKETPKPRGTVNLVWAVHPDASARKEYGPKAEKAPKKQKAAAKKRTARGGGERKAKKPARKASRRREKKEPEAQPNGALPEIAQAPAAE